LVKRRFTPGAGLPRERAKNPKERPGKGDAGGGGRRPARYLTAGAGAVGGGRQGLKKLCKRTKSKGTNPPPPKLKGVLTSAAVVVSYATPKTPGF